MTSNFAGSTAQHYRRYRRDVAAVVLTDVREMLRLTSADWVFDLGCGTGQVAVPLAPHVRAVIAVDPEPDMLAQLNARIADEGIENVTTVLGADSELDELLAGCDAGSVAAVTVATALHWMEAEHVFRTSRDRLRAGGGVAVITQGTPIWLQDSAWSRELRSYLQTWVGPLTSTCGTDWNALERRRELMVQVGFQTVRAFSYSDRLATDLDYVIGNLYSAMPEQQIAAGDRQRFERGLRAALKPHVDAAPLVEHLDATLLIGQV